MIENNDEYRLEFIIPVGPTGPTGPQGSIGPMNNLNPIIFIDYDDTTIYNVSLPILNTTILYDTQNIFTIQSGLIYINQPGYYIFTVSGNLKEQSDQDSTLILRTRIRDGTAFKDLITVKLNTGEFTKYFTYTKLGFYSVPQAILVILNKRQNSGASLENVTLIIQKISYNNWKRSLYRYKEIPFDNVK